MSEAGKTKGVNDLITFLRETGRLKSITREGWLRVGVKNPESVADHSYRLAIMAMVLGKKAGLNVDKLAKMALVHDLGEIGSGDITPHDKASAEKREREIKAAGELLQLLGDQEYLAIWREYASGTSEEAWFLKQLDKLEMALQALDYEERFPDLNFDTFWRTARAEIRISLLIEILRTIEAKRGQLRK